jgi:hypothetical protein
MDPRRWVILRRSGRMGIPSSTETENTKYPAVVAAAATLTDHFEDQRRKLTAEELECCRTQKQEHYYGGLMDWPDRLNRPSRTITATRTKTSRSTIVFKCPHHRKDADALRALTVRECATLQGFPTTYQFWARAMTAKDSLVGNAVPPPLSRTLANAILKEEGLPVRRSPRIFRSPEAPPPVNYSPRRKHRYSIARRFRGFVKVDWRHECRVELGNVIARLDRARDGSSSELQVGWVTRLYLGYAKEYRCYEVPRQTALELIEKAYEKVSDKATLQASVSRLLREASLASEELSDAYALQERWTGRSERGVSPMDILSMVETMVERTLPRERWGGVMIPREVLESSLTGHWVSGGKDADAKPPLDLPIRTSASLLALAVACASINTRPTVRLHSREVEILPRHGAGIHQ